MSSICNPLSGRLVVSERQFRRKTVIFFVPILLWAVNLAIVIFGLPFLIIGWLRR